MNSQPLFNIDNYDADCINILTGDVIFSTPEVPLSSSPNLKNRWDLLQKLKRDFYKKWTKTYLSSRKKWKNSAPNIKKGDIVLLNEDSHLPRSLPISHIIEVHPVTDGMTTVVTEKVKNSKLVWNINKISLLPMYLD